MSPGPLIKPCSYTSQAKPCSLVPLISPDVREKLDLERGKIDGLKKQHPTGLTNYQTTYKHDFAGKLGENRDASFVYSSNRSLSPEVASKTSSRSSTPNSDEQ
jgi:hypothetical protein